MEFLSVGLDKQPQFRTTETNPERRRRDATRRGATHVYYPLLPFESSPRTIPFVASLLFSKRPLFRLECNFSYNPARFISRYIAAFIAIDSRPLLYPSPSLPLVPPSFSFSFSLSPSLFSPVESYVVDPVAAEKWRSYLHATFRNDSAYVHSSPNANSRSALSV